MNDIAFPKPSLTALDITEDQIAATENESPTTFSLKAQLLDQGRTDTVLAATDDLSVRLKVYASGGENGLHAHVGEDHVFVILQGSARFFGPDDEAVDLGPHQGIMMPKGMLYRFYATSEDECLVMLRIGTPNFQKQPEHDRVDAEGKPMLGDSEANKTVATVFKEGVFFGGS
jgi:mannose-6-phosphate isomerase-like protein (cupin superfamily)